MNKKTEKMVKELEKLREDNSREYWDLTGDKIQSRQIIALVDLLCEKGVL